MPLRRITGSIDAIDARIAIVVSRWNEAITGALVSGAERAFAAYGVGDDQVTVIEVPGAFEIPLACELLAKSGSVDAIVALGCVIKGETAHFEYVSNAAMEGIRDVMLRHKLPVTCGILTTYTYEQSEARARADENNKGSEAALTALEMISLSRRIESL
jgi:6,7-dimethyl-8-ribityllumazine synthase